MSHPQVVQSPIVNDCLKVKIDVHTKPQLVPELLLQVSVIEPHSNLDSDTVDGVLKESIDEDDNIIIIDSTLRSLLPPQFKKMLISNVKLPGSKTFEKQILMYFCTPKSDVSLAK